MVFEDEALWKALLAFPPCSPTVKSIPVSDLTNNRNIFKAYLHPYPCPQWSPAWGVPIDHQTWPWSWRWAEARLGCHPTGAGSGSCLGRVTQSDPALRWPGRGLLPAQNQCVTPCDLLIPAPIPRAIFSTSHPGAWTGNLAEPRRWEF